MATTLQRCIMTDDCWYRKALPRLYWFLLLFERQSGRRPQTQTQ